MLNGQVAVRFTPPPVRIRMSALRQVVVARTTTADLEQRILKAA